MTNTEDNEIQAPKLDKISELKTNLAEQYIKELKEHKTIIVQGIMNMFNTDDQFKQYLLSESTVEGFWTNLHTNLIGNIIGNLDKNSFMIKGKEYSSILVYLQEKKQEIENAKTEDDLQKLKDGITTTQTYETPTPDNNNLQSTNNKSTPEDNKSTPEDNKSTSGNKQTTSDPEKPTENKRESTLIPIAPITPVIVPSISSSKEELAKQYISPIETNKNPIITSKFGRRKIFGKKDFHEGMDIAAPQGTEIVAIAGGEVVKSAYEKNGGGRYVIIQNNNGERFSYLHLQEKSPLSIGDEIEKGSIIGKVGSTGRSTGPHLHLAVKENDKYIDPLEKFPDIFEGYERA